MSDRLIATAYGFKWWAEGGGAPLEVERTYSFEGGKVVHVHAGDRRKAIEVYVSPEGRSIRAFRDGKELTDES